MTTEYIVQIRYKPKLRGTKPASGFFSLFGKFGAVVNRGTLKNKAIGQSSENGQLGLRIAEP